MVAVAAVQDRDSALAGEDDLAPALVAAGRDLERLPGALAEDAQQPKAARIGHRASRRRQLSEDLEPDRHVVRSEVPDRVDVGVRMTPADARGVEPDDRAELVAPGQVGQELDSRVVAP